MNWADLWRVATRTGAEEVLLDECLNAIAHRQELSLRAVVAVEVPSVQRLCCALDTHGVEVPPESAARVVVLERLNS
jgi:hypothetical protein